VSSEGQPSLTVQLTGPSVVPVATPEGQYTIIFLNSGYGTALDAELRIVIPDGVNVADPGGGTLADSVVSFAVGSIGQVESVDPPASASHSAQLSFAGEGTYTLEGELVYRVGLTDLVAGPVTLAVGVGVEPPGPDGGGGAGASPPSGGAGATAAAADAEGGCGCRIGRPATAHGWLVGVAGLGLGLARRRARRRRAPR
jgi:MYXO-CTERM domain-containing protein